MLDLNSRIINLSPYNAVSITTRTIHHTLIDEATIIVENDDDYFFIQDDIEKIRDISQMPDYIKQDWLKYNRKKLTTKILDWHILDYINKSESQYPNEELTSIINQLKSIKRHLIIKKII